VIFELRRGSPDLPLLTIASSSLSTLSMDESREAYSRVKIAAEGGSAFAMCLLATWPDIHGRGRLTDSERYVWAERAARCGYPPGLFELGICLEKGIGVPMDLQKAWALFERSAAGGFGFAAHRLGTGYMDGLRGFVDAPKAVHFMELACEHGESLGALYLGQWFESGEGVMKDLPTAVRWYERASDMGSFFATHRMQMAYVAGDLGLPRDTNLAKHYEARLFEQTKVETRGGPSSHG
jgi:hypothetical protein